MPAIVFILTFLTLLLLIIVSMHITTVIQLGGYRGYLHTLKLLRSFKSVDKKISEKRTLKGTLNSRNIYLTEFWSYSFYYEDSSKLYQVSYKNKIRMSLGVYFYVFNFNKEDSNYKRKEYYISGKSDIIYSFLYIRLVRKIRKVKSIQCDNKDSLLNEVNKARKQKLRESQLSSILN